MRHSAEPTSRVTLGALVLFLVRPSVSAVVASVTQGPVRDAAVVTVTTRPAAWTVSVSCRRNAGCD